MPSGRILACGASSKRPRRRYGSGKCPAFEHMHINDFARILVATIQLHTWTQDSRPGAKRLSREATQQKPRSLYCEARSFIEYSPTVSQPRSRAKQTRPRLGKGPTVHLSTTQFYQPKEIGVELRGIPLKAMPGTCKTHSSSTIFTENLRRNANTTVNIE
jgi:hypothetical protein